MDKITKTVRNKLGGGEKGQVLILVLILLTLGVLIITPLLAYMSTGIKAGQSNENLMQRLYAADAGVENAIWRIRNDYSLPATVDSTVAYSITSGVNNKGVTVVIKKEDDALEFIRTLLDIPAQAESHLDWWQVTDNMFADGTYTITVTNIKSETKKLDVIGAWFAGTYSVNGTATITSNITDAYDTPALVVEPFEGGTAILWIWKSQPYGINLNRPTFKEGDQMTLTFHFTPAVVPGLYTAFAKAGSSDIGVVGGMVTFGIYKVTSTATDNTTSKKTEVVSYVARMGILPLASVLTWEVSLK